MQKLFQICQRFLLLIGGAARLSYSKRSTLLYIFKELNISPSFLEIELVPQGVNGDADEDE